MARLSPRFDWTAEPRLQRIMSALEDGGTARFVGGCVRDSLLGHSPFDDTSIDIDIATDRTPSEMKDALAAGGIRAVPTGEAHGTITAVVDGLVAECTSLRADIDTDGRHAAVRFTRDWDEDWRRRDFTINALYADEKGTVWDPAGGIPDLEAGRVRFIGNASTRIEEDALRILRFFRFSARFADRFDAEGISAVRNLAPLLDRLSRERVWSELSRIFPAARAGEAVAAAAETRILQRILPGDPRVDDFRRLRSAGEPSPHLALATLWPGLDRATLKRALKPSNALLDQYEEVQRAASALTSGMAAEGVLYRFGRELALEAQRLIEARSSRIDPAVAEGLRNLRVPQLPIRGRDLLARGVPPGPEVKRLLRAFEEAWLQDGAPCHQSDIERLLTDVLSGKSAR